MDNLIYLTVQYTSHKLDDPHNRSIFAIHTRHNKSDIPQLKTEMQIEVILSLN